MADEKQRNPGGFGKRGELRGDGAGLRHAAGDTLHAGGVHCLHRVDDDERGLDLVHVACHHVEVGFGGEEESIVQRARAFRAHAHLACGFLGGDVEGGATERSPAAGDLEQQGGLAHAGLAGEEHHGALDNP